jgi:alpha-beta hydrolase superfamily lysophospholipase
MSHLRMAVSSVVLALSFAAPARASLPRHSVLGAVMVDRDGVRISAIRPGGAADRGGLHVDDAVQSFGGDPVRTSAEFVSRVKMEPAGRPVAFRVRRGDAVLTLPITLDTAQDEQDPLVDTLYKSIEVDGSLRRTLVTVPRGSQGRRPAVLILGGMGCYSIDNAADSQDPYLRLAHDLGRRGIVVMRVEKSGVGDSQGPHCMTVDLKAEMHSYAVALDELQRDAHADPRCIYLFGHSIGTIIAPRLANQNKVAGVIIAEAVGRNWFEYELWNLRRQLDLSGDSAAQVDAALAMKEICMHRLLIEKQPETEIEHTQPECKIHNDYPAAASYVQEVAALNIAEPWTRFSLPLLAIYGTGDFVTAEADHHRIVNLVDASNPGAATLKLIAGMDHHLDVAGTEQQAYDLRVKQHRAAPYDEELSTVVVDWLCRREKCSAPAG